MAEQTGTILEVVEGMQFDKGYLSSYMVSDTDKMEAVLENPYILLTDAGIGGGGDWQSFGRKTLMLKRMRS